MRTTIRATEKTDVEATVADLRVRCERADVPSHDTSMIVEQTAETLRSFMKRVEELGSAGSQMHVAREIAGEGYSVKIIFDTGSRRTALQKLTNVLWGARMMQRSSHSRYPRYSYRTRYSRSAGHRRALEHIREAQQLTRELGGSDQDVKKYFFSIPPKQLLEIFDEYENQFGIKAREYAEETLPKWRDGQVQMSGMVASRLFRLLPPRMPLAAKYKLTENLWRHTGPKSHKIFRIGLDAEVEDVVTAIHDHIERVVLDYNIPETLERRFEWLSAGDIHVKQRLLNYVRQMEKDLVTDGARKQIPIMLEHLRGSEGRYTHRLAQVFEIGKHKLEILVDEVTTGVKLEEPSAVSIKTSVTSSSGFGYGWVWWFIVGAVILFFVVR